jgi:ATP-dependent Clp protease ATP-binding subunit ClpB
MEKHAVARLIGAPPGYVGFEEGGQLTEAVRRRPHAVILFDEIEKAHQEVFNVLLQILDDGRLTDAHGRTVDFRNAVVIMTSNIGSQYILDRSDTESWEDIEAYVRRELHSHFRPEFLNRLDEVILFQPLGPEQLRTIVDLQLERVVSLAADLGVELELTTEARDLIAREGHEPAFGARPLKRAIQRLVQDPLALFLLEREAEGLRIRIIPGLEGGGLVFEVAGEPGSRSGAGDSLNQEG